MPHVLVDLEGHVDAGGSSESSSDSGTAQAGGTNTITLAATASATDDLYNSQVVHISAGTGAGQVGNIIDYVGSTKVATVDANWVTQPDNTSVYKVLPTANIPKHWSHDVISRQVVRP